MSFQADLKFTVQLSVILKFQSLCFHVVRTENTRHESSCLVYAVLCMELGALCMTGKHSTD